MDLLLLIGSLAVILVAAELFTNGIEWFGHRLNLAEGAVGSVLAAVATAMPETLIPIIAIIGPLLVGSEPGTSAEVGVGAILGAPFMLATLAMFVTGLAVLIVARNGRRSSTMQVSVRVLWRDVIVFLAAYAVAIGTALLPAIGPLRWGIAALLAIGYLLYVRAHFRDSPEPGEGEEPGQLHLTRLVPNQRRMVDVDVLPGEVESWEASEAAPALRIIVAQVLVALALIIVGARVFVGAVEHLSTTIGLDPRILALIIAPIATELPEKFNSIIWVRNGKDTLAMGNITGAMVFQSCLPTIIGILFTDWRLTEGTALSFASAGAAFLATVIIFGAMRLRGSLTARWLLVGGPIYAVYVVAALLLPAGVPVGH